MYIYIYIYTYMLCAYVCIVCILIIIFVYVYIAPRAVGTAAAEGNTERALPSHVAILHHGVLLPLSGCTPCAECVFLRRPDSM